MRTLFYICLLIITPQALAESRDAGHCQTVHWTKGRIYNLKAALHQTVHIILPDRLLTLPTPGNKELWMVEGAGNHLYVKPTHTSHEGRTITVSAVDRQNRSYEFLVTRVKGLGDVCVIIEPDGGLIAEPQAFDQWRSPREIADIGTSRSDAVAAALASYRHHIYTGYYWRVKGDGWLGDDFVRDVYDDGRFTYVRVAEANKGLMSIQGDIDGATQSLEYDFDDKYKMYQISGIFPELALRYGDKSHVSITRSDSTTSGGY